MNHMTAKVSCFARAYHNCVNAHPVFADTAAAALLGEEFDLIAQNMTDGIPFFLPKFSGTPEEGLRLIVDKQLSPSVLGRSAFCERMLQNEKQLGCRQYIVFAAGYDTFSIRNTDKSLRVFELDLPDVLTDKREKIKTAGLKSCAVDIPCNLSQKQWTQKLLAGGYQPKKKAFGSLLGISYYLSQAAFQTLLTAAGHIMPAGSAICFDYPAVNESEETKVNQTLAQGAGEPMKASYSYREMKSLLAACRFEIYEHLQHDTMTAQYFSEYNLHTPDHPIAAPVGVDYVLAVKHT